MISMELRYVAHIITLTRTVKEAYSSQAATLRELIGELDRRFHGFQGVFVDPQSGALKLNAMIYYAEPDRPPVSVIDLDRPLSDRSVITFW
jgi:hypothetical protein